MTDWQRLEQVIKWTGLSTNAFAMGIGLKRSENLYQIKRGNNGISKELAELITRKYPALSRAWLLTGEGEQFAAEEADVKSTAGPGKPQKGIPFYTIDVVRFVSEGLSGAQPLYHIDVPGFGGCDFAGLNTGSAMQPDVPSGAIVVLKRINPEALLLPGEIYLVVTPDFAALRYVKVLPAEGKVTLVAANGSEYEPITLSRSQIEQLFLVKGIIIQKVL